MSYMYFAFVSTTKDTFPSRLTASARSAICRYPAFDRQATPISLYTAFGRGLDNLPGFFLLSFFASLIHSIALTTESFANLAPAKYAISILDSTRSGRCSELA